jgi:hypothetical protein
MWLGHFIGPEAQAQVAGCDKLVAILESGRLFIRYAIGAIDWKLERERLGRSWRFAAQLQSQRGSIACGLSMRDSSKRRGGGRKLKFCASCLATRRIVQTIIKTTEIN